MKKICFASLMALFLVGCNTTGVAPQGSINYLIDRNYTATDRLLSSGGSAIDRASPVIVATIVNVDSLEESSRLGRTVSEQISARLAQQGYRPVELKLRNNIFIKQDEGELLLSREVKNIAQSHKTDIAIVGTYSASSEVVFINLKAINTGDNTVVSSYDYTLRRAGCAEDVLRSSGLSRWEYTRAYGIGPSDYPCAVVRSLLNSVPYEYPQSYYPGSLYPFMEHPVTSYYKGRE